MNQSFDFDTWHQMLTEELWWRKPCREESQLIYQRTVNAWGHGMNHYAQNGAGKAVDLTKLYEQCKMLTILKGE